MAENYSVFIDIVSVDKATRNLRQIHKEVSKLSSSAKVLNNRLNLRADANKANSAIYKLSQGIKLSSEQAKNLGIELKKIGYFSEKSLEPSKYAVDSLKKSINSANQAFRRMAVAIKIANKELKQFDGISNSIRFGGIRFADILNRDLTEAKSKASSLNETLKQTKEILKSGPGPKISSRVSGASKGNGSGAGALGVEAETAGLLGVGIGALGKFAASRITPVAAAYGAYKVGRAAFDTDTEYQQEMLIARLSGRPEVAAQLQQVRSAPAIPGISKLEEMQAYIDSFTVTKDPTQARKLGPLAARMMLEGSTISPDYTHRQNQQFLQSIEAYTGSANAETLKKAADAFSRMLIAESMRVLPDQLNNFMKTGGSAAKQLSTQGLLPFIPLIQQQGGFRTGTGLMTSFLALSAGHLQTKDAEALKKIGLYKGKIRYDTTGRKIATGELYRQDLASRDPYQYYQSIAKPLLIKAGYETSDERIDFISKHFTRNASNQFINFEQNQEKIENYIKQFQMTAGISDTLQQSLNTNAGKLKQLGASWNNFLLELGNFLHPVTNFSLDVMNSITNKATERLKEMQKSRGLGFFSSMIPTIGQARKMETKGLLGERRSTQAIAPASTSNPNVKVEIHMDGKEISHHVVKKVSSQLKKSHVSGPSSFNQEQSATPTNYNSVGGF